MRPLYGRQDLLPLIAPQSIGVIGASARENSFGARVLANLSAYAGRIHLVNARYTILDGRPCHDSLAALPEVPDCAVIVVAREAVEEVLTQCADAGVRAAIVFASGYAETGKPGRAEDQARLAALARRRGLRLAGPNCIGLANIATGAAMTFSGMPAWRAPAPHAVGIVSQSGALGFAMAQAIERGAAISHVLTSGNAIDVDTADYVAALAEEPRCRAIACLFEGMAEPLRLIEAARRAWEADKPLVICKIATGAHGAAAALSHTASLAGADDAWRACLAEAGAVLVGDPPALVETASFLAKAGRPLARGVAVAATSGGAGIIAADTAERHGVPLPQPAPDTSEILVGRIPEFGSARNPCDVTAQ
ncbi:MAG TPA: CoA-binding protein, partial [Acetobacteraceae bacterium]|nr:CoA-binding protein [Acetobacteraceae bacterium]